jgi:hypothetical protein
MNADIEEKDGVRYVKNMQLLGVSLIASENVVDENTRIVEELNAPFYDPHRPLNLEKDIKPRGMNSSIFHLDDFGYFIRGSTRIPVMTHESHPFVPEMNEEEMLAKLDALGISRNVLKLEIPSAVEAARAEPYCVILTSDDQLIDCTLPEEKVSIVDVMNAMPFGTGITGFIHKRSFDYELIGGV